MPSHVGRQLELVVSIELYFKGDGAMGLLQEIAESLGSDNLKRLSAGKGNFEDQNSPDQDALQEMVKSIDPKQLQQVFGKTARQIDPEDYSDHVTPGVGGTDPLGKLGAGGLGTIASVLLSRLKEAGAAIGTQQSKSPALQTTDPKQMSADEVAAMARYAQQNHPEAFGKAATDISQKEPALLHSFLGKAALAVTAAALASHFIKPDRK
jgi:hypothetical protein